jgi:hypothetical protein
MAVVGRENPTNESRGLIGGGLVPLGGGVPVTTNESTRLVGGGEMVVVG